MLTLSSFPKWKIKANYQPIFNEFIISAFKFKEPPEYGKTSKGKRLRINRLVSIFMMPRRILSRVQCGDFNMCTSDLSTVE